MKNILITGVCGGIGYAVAKHLVEQGYNVFGLDRASSCELPLTYFQTDVTDIAQIERAYSEIAQSVDNLYSILHFAGIYNMNSLIEIDEKDFVKIFDVNLFGMFRINKVFFPLLSKGSRIVMTSSELAPLDPLPFTGLYGFTKTAVEKYAFSLRMELQLHGIDVVVLRPGAVKTELLNDSTTALDKLCQNTQLYAYNAEQFKKIVCSVETKNISPQKVAKLTAKILKAKRPKYLYSINRNPLLKILNGLPDRWQVKIIGKILKNK